jgi:hypothetical protein
METRFNTVSFALFAAAIATIISVVHEVRGRLDERSGFFPHFSPFPQRQFQSGSWQRLEGTYPLVSRELQKAAIRMFSVSCLRVSNGIPSLDGVKSAMTALGTLMSEI